jgi:hypothetical protein
VALPQSSEEWSEYLSPSLRLNRGLACRIDQREEKRKARGPKLGETQKADRFWFAPGAAKKAGQWRLRTSRCCNHAGLFLDRPKHRSHAPLTENAKSGQVLVRTWGGKKGRPVAAPDEPLLQPCGAVPRSPQTPEPRTINGKRKKADRFWFARGKIKPNPSTILKGYVRSSESGGL